MQNKIKVPHFYLTLEHFDVLNLCVEFLYGKSVDIQSDNSIISFLIYKERQKDIVPDVETHKWICVKKLLKISGRIWT